ncbi:Ipi1 protein [Saccharomycopsis crataegensis]|uniref:Pre-rRNA-processing protein n=1 Tax=Saccharomycopsis crataegensis TaxID=43959 RepID=A0AAV5QE61_9ASCO|nr:Ipi1 protein [Saccharomycopsis crataegensis]
MGSKKKTKEKKKDFIKQRLKVGKDKPKASNHTDVSFTAKSISIPRQSVLDVKTNEAEFAKNISLTRHATPQVRKEAVLFLAKHWRSHPTMLAAVISSIAKLILDQSGSVRGEVLKLLKTLPSASVQLHYTVLVLYVQSAMTHIGASVRHDSSKFLEVLMEDGGCGKLLVDNHWIKLSRCFFSLLHWPINAAGVGLAVTVGSSAGGGGGGQAARTARVRHLQVLGKFIEQGAVEVKSIDTEAGQIEAEGPHVSTQCYVTPDVPGPFQHLRLFARAVNIEGDLNNMRFEDVLVRRKVLVDVFTERMMKELRSIVKEGGEVGRVANSLSVMMERVMEDEKNYQQSIGAS